MVFIPVQTVYNFLYMGNLQQLIAIDYRAQFAHGWKASVRSACQQATTCDRQTKIQGWCRNIC